MEYNNQCLLLSYCQLGTYATYFTLNIYLGQNDKRRGKEGDDRGERSAEPDARLLEPVHLLQH